MENIKEIKQRIKSVNNIQQITNAMKMVASAKLRRLQIKLEKLRPYSDNIAKLLARILPATMGDEHPLLAESNSRHPAVVVLTSDKGLCGGFNNQIYKQFHRFERGNDFDTLHLIVIGKKGIQYFKKLHYEIMDSYHDIYDKLSFSTTTQISKRIIGHFLEEKIDAVYFLYSLFISPIQTVTQSNQILPFDMEHLKRAKVTIDKSTVQPDFDAIVPQAYLYEPSLEHVTTQLIYRFIATELHRSIIESVTSEFGARMTAMTNATNNAFDLIEYLNLKYNRARQDAITKEILDIVNGAEALK